ncbi:uncharacterized protein LOC128467993 [Spea bombifrons]|uniref:uncharacterized protein LOC128467993 n=1 Tax=Spea bombifrons TaxID=233779 RepID=UPI00234ADFF3|nr:uncharacterized protein LOC128467993 [Spea bombifrons]
MNRHRESGKIHLSEAKTSWEDQSGCEVAAGKLEVMEKFFTPLPHSAIRRSAKKEEEERSSWNRMKDPYNNASLSSSSPSSSSSQWSSESSFRGQVGFPRYYSCAPHSRSCNDLSIARGKRNTYEKEAINMQQKGASELKQLESTEKIITSDNRVGSTKLKGYSPQRKDDTHGGLEKKTLIEGGRRARSMEALAVKQSDKRQAKDNRKVIEQKQRFSRFLDEITIQVLSPSNLNSLGVKESQVVGALDPWKNSSTDSSGSREKRRHDAMTERQEQRRKGRGKGETTRPKVGANAPSPRRSRDMSTSPDSASSSAWKKRTVKKTQSPPPIKQNPRKNKASNPQITSQEREIKGRSRLERIQWMREEDCKGDRAMLQEQAPYIDNPQNCESSKELITQVPIIPPPDWWGDHGSSLPRQSNDNVPDTSSRNNESFPGTELNDQSRENNLHSANDNLETNRDSLNQKITELLDHLVRAQSTICALEKLNVSSLLRHLPPDMLDSVKTSHVSTDVGSHFKSLQDTTSAGISSETCCQDSNGSNLQCTAEKTMGVSTGPLLTAFTPWSPKKQKFLPTLHSIYTSTESDCSLEDVLPACKLLPPRFPMLGESFSDDRKDGVTLDAAETRTENTVSASLKPTFPVPNLLPTHRVLPRKHHTRPNSSESSGDELHVNWGQIPSQELNYLSAQKILDTILGLSSSSEQSPATHPKNIGEYSNANVSPNGYPRRADLQFTMSDGVSRGDSNHLSNSAKCRDTSKNSERCSPSCFSSTMSSQAFHSSDYATPPLPAKRSPLPRSIRNSFPNPSVIDETGFHLTGQQASLLPYESECLRQSGSMCSQVPGYSSDLFTDHSLPLSLKSPSGNESLIGDWDSFPQTKRPEDIPQRKPRRERTVHFQTLNEVESREGQAALRSKFMATKVENKKLSDNASVDSTLL